MTDKQKFAFGRMNFILLAVGMLVVILGFVLMCGPSSTEQAFNPDIFSVRRIRVAPVICFLGFISMIFGILYKPKTTEMPEQGAGSEREIGMKEDPKEK